MKTKIKYLYKSILNRFYGMFITSIVFRKKVKTYENRK